MPGKLRVGVAWALAVVFLWFARPEIASLLIGSCFAVGGLLLRAWAAGTVDKGRELAVRGPYAFTRNPLYLGSFVIGVGVASAGGHWAWPVLFAAFFVLFYVPTMRREAAELARRFGEEYRSYQAQVPAMWVRLEPYRAGCDGAASGREATGFSWTRYMRYREWEAVLGVAALLGVLAFKLRLPG